MTRALMHAPDSEGWPSPPQFFPCGNGSGNGQGDEGSEHCMAKRPGRLQTRPSFLPEEDEHDDSSTSSVSLPGGVGGVNPEGPERVGNDTFTPAASSSRRRMLQRVMSARVGLPDMLGAPALWTAGFKGQAVKMGVFDTGIKADHPHVQNIK